MVKNVCGHSNDMTLQLALSHKGIMKETDFFHVDTNLGKLIFTVVIIGWAWSRIGMVF